MQIPFPNGAVAAPGWSVSRTLSRDIPAGGRLSVARFDGMRLLRRGDHNGRDFATDAEYEAFVREHGYVMPYRRSVSAWKRAHRREIARQTRAMVAAIMRAADHSEIIAIGDAQKAWARSLGCGLLDSLIFANGATAAARRLRRDIYDAATRDACRDDAHY